MDIKTEIEWVLTLQKLSGHDSKRFLKVHREVFGTAIDPCMNCPDQIRHAVNRLKHYYNEKFK